MILNMYKTFISFNLFICFLLIIGACNKDSETTTTTIIKNPPEIVIANSELVVNLEDENGVAVEGLTAVFNDSIQVIDGRSFFHFRGKDINKLNEVLRITDADGNEHQFNSLILENEINYRKVNLFMNKEGDSFSAANEKNISLDGNFLLTFPRQNYFLGTDTEYNRQVNIKYNVFDLQNKNHVNCLPGGKTMLFDNEYSMVIFKAAFDFSLHSDDNKSLSLKKPAKLLSGIQENGVLTYYNSALGHWELISEYFPGKEVLLPYAGTYAIAEVKDRALLKGELFLNGLPMINAEIKITGSGFEYSAFSTQSGKWEIEVPRYSNIEIKYASPCGDVVMGDILANQVNNTLSPVYLTSVQVDEFTLSGRVLDCQLNVVDHTFIEIESEHNKKIVLIPKSQFSLRLPLCLNESYTFRFLEPGSSFISRPWVFKKGDMNFGDVLICPNLKDQYVGFSIGNDYSLYTDISTKYSSSILEIKGKKESNDPGFLLRFGHNGQAGSLTTDLANIQLYNSDFGGYGISINCPTSNDCGFENIELNYFEENDDFIKGEFKGNFWTQIFSPSGAVYKEIKGVFQVKK